MLCSLATLVAVIAVHGMPTDVEPTPDKLPVVVEIIEGVPDKRSWDFEPKEVTEQYHERALAFVAIPKKYSDKGLVTDRSSAFVLRASAKQTLPAGKYRVLLRSRNAARVFWNEQLLAETPFIKANASGHESVPDVQGIVEENLRLLQPGDQERVVDIELDGGVCDIRLEAFIGGQRLRHELGELAVAIAGEGEPFRLVGLAELILLSDLGWHTYIAESLDRIEDRNRATRHAAAEFESQYWMGRHEHARQLWTDRDAVRLPAEIDSMPGNNVIDRFINARLHEREAAPTALADDLSFLRRVTLDTAGVIPTTEEVRRFMADPAANRRARAIDRLLDDPRWADHWVGYWQDVLAENPGILKPTLNNTGPFRWWLYESFVDNKPMDRFVTELLMMQGSKMGGGPAGFGVATLNDAPMAAKTHVAAKAFLGIELQCARCHDAPFHPFKQKDLFSLAAMLGRAEQKIPATSTVPIEERTRRPLVEVTLEAGSTVDPAWPFTDLAPETLPTELLRDSSDSRERLAALITSPDNVRFAQVLVNRLWKRYIGLGLVEPVDDWVDVKPSHPELLDYLSRELITHSYDLKHVARLILNSHVYQREPAPGHSAGVPEAESRLFAGPVRRRLTAEQIVDSLFLAVGKEFRCEELNLDVDGRRPITEFLNLGTPRRAWEFTSLSNERDRPALSLPVAQSVVDVLTTFGWRESRQNPLTVRDETATVLQPLMLANGVVASRVTRLSDDSAITALCLEDQPLEQLVDAVYLQLLSRAPTDTERRTFVDLLQEGYAERVVAKAVATRSGAPRLSAVSWSNHLSPEATRLKLEQERAARAGDPATERLVASWRERMEDMIWALVNSPEFLFVP